MCDIAHIVTATLTLETTLQMQFWKEHVDSQANLADCGPKDTFDHVPALGISWENLETPPWSSKVATTSATEWLHWFHVGKITWIAITGADNIGTLRVVLHLFS